jgi:cytoskeletal protein RodZ
MSDHHNEFVRIELRHALDSREPDRTAMLNRIAANRAAGTRPRGQAVRLAGSALAVATVLGLGGVAKWALADEEHTAPPVAVATPPATSASADGTASTGTNTASTAPSTRPRTSAPASTAASATSPTAPTPAVSLVRGHPGDTKTEKGSLKSAGDVPAPGQNRVKLVPGAALTELALDIRVPLTPGLTAGAGTTDTPAGAITVTVDRRTDALIYHFTLAAGKKLQAGTYYFTAAYTGPHDVADDTYEAYVYSVEKKDIHVYGNFLPQEE